MLALFMSPGEDGGPSGDERAAELTRDAWKTSQGRMTPATLWSMPVRHLLMLYFDPPGRGDADQDRMARAAAQNRGRAVPIFPSWLLPELE